MISSALICSTRTAATGDAKRLLRRLGLLVTLTGVAVLSGSAVAHATVQLPSFSNNRIVLNDSIGGFTLGTPVATTTAALGSHATNCQDGQCGWGSISGEELVLTFGAARPHGPSVLTEVAIQAYTSGERAGGLGRLRTSKGIGLGSTTHALTVAYPHLRHTRTEYYTRTTGLATLFKVRHGQVVLIIVENLL